MRPPPHVDMHKVRTSTELAALASVRRVLPSARPRSPSISTPISQHLVWEPALRDTMAYFLRGQPSGRNARSGRREARRRLGSVCPAGRLRVVSGGRGMAQRHLSAWRLHPLIPPSASQHYGALLIPPRRKGSRPRSALGSDDPPRSSSSPLLRPSHPCRHFPTSFPAPVLLQPLRAAATTLRPLLSAQGLPFTSLPGDP